HPGRHGELRTVGLSSDGVPYVTASEGFQVTSVNKKKLTVTHQDPNCMATFYAPKNAFQDIHLHSIVSLDVTKGGLGVSVCAKNKLKIWDVQRGIIRRELLGHVGDVYSCRFFPSGLVILSAGADMQLKIWSAETGQCPVTMTGHTAAILDTAIVDKGRNVISVSRDGSAKLWDCGNSACLTTLIQLNNTINGCYLGCPETGLGHLSNEEPENSREVGTNGKLLLLACEDNCFRGVCVRSRQNIFTHPCEAPVNACCQVNSLQTVFGCQNGEIKLLDLRNTRDTVDTWLHSAASILSIIPLNEGFVCSKLDGSCMYYSPKLDNSWQLSGPDCDPVYKIAFDETHLYTCCRDGIIRKYEVKN
uniref:Uncharacterized protein n=1 Tax=Strigamia maritima TaxID=126957 RepID=T1IYX6_STRMM